MKKSIKLLTSALLLAVVTLFSSSAFADSEVYTVAMEPTFPPFEMLDSKTGKITGFDVDLIKAIAKDQGFQVEINALGFDGLIPAVLTGKLDMSISGFTITDKRAKVINFSDPYIDAGIGVLKRSDDDSIQTLDDLKDKTAVVQIGSSGQKVAEDLKASGKLKAVVVMDNVALAVADLIKGRADVVVNDVTVNVAYAKGSNGVIVMLKTPLNKEEYGIVVSKSNPELLEKVNKGLANIRANGTYDKIYAKYFKAE